MKQLMLAAVASIALSLPAMAQSNNTNGTQPDNQTQMSPQGQNGQSQGKTGADRQQAQNQIDPSKLGSQQVRQIQSALDKKGFNVRHVDGKWGPHTEAALKNFQQKQNIQGGGRLDQQTLAALGVSVTGQGRQGSSTTGAGSKEDQMSSPAQNPGRTQNNNMSGQTESGGSGSAYKQ